MRWEIHTADGPEKVTAHTTDIPGLLVYRRPGGWYVGHQNSGTRVSTWPTARKEHAQALAVMFGPLCDWARVTRDEMPEDLGDRVHDAEIELYGKPLPWVECGDKGCLREKGHPGVHKSHGKQWRRKEDDVRV
jgi:hypothetical protein